LAEFEDGSCVYFGCGSGCTNPLACNYDSSAAADDGSCLLLSSECEECVGITIGFDPELTQWSIQCVSDEDGDGICDCDELAGCQDVSACNFNVLATDDDGSCTYAETGYDCDGNCLVDSDGDQICEQDEITGCQDASACNYDSTATDAGYCDYPIANYDCDGACLNDVDGDGVCDEFEVAGCTDCLACNYSSEATDDDGSCTYPDFGYDCDGNCADDGDGDGLCDPFEISGCTDEAACNYDDVATDDDGSCNFPESLYDCEGTCLNDADGDGVCDELELPGCLDEEAMNFNPYATDEDGSCIYIVMGCTDEEACNYDVTANMDDGSCAVPDFGYDCGGMCLNDADGDGVCDLLEVLGCMAETACNYNPSATDSAYCYFPQVGYDCNGDCLEDADGDGVCDSLEVPGCMDGEACNFDCDATDDDGSCTYSESGFDCAGNCLFDDDGDGICDQDEITGCQDTSACNYDANATDAGYCDYAEAGYDCAGACLNDADGDGVCDEEEEALNEAIENALEDLLSAIASGAYCGDGTIWVPEWSQCIAVPTCFADLDGDGNRGTEDLLMLLSVYGTGCPAIWGCTNPEADNYDPVAEFDDGSCIVPFNPCYDQTAMNYFGVNYDLVVVGDQCWFADNLEATVFANGDVIPEVNGSFDWYTAGANGDAAQTLPGGANDDVSGMGRLYNGFAVNDARGLCPTDWHVATDEDWHLLEATLGMDEAELTLTGARGTDEGAQLKASELDLPSWDGTNAAEFAAVPAGQRYSFGSAFGFGNLSQLWTSSNVGNSNWARELNSGSDQIERALVGRGFGGSVRCIRDSEE